MNERPHRWGAVGNAIVSRRQHLRMSQTDLSRRSGVSDLTLRRIENGDEANYRAKGLQAIEDALGWAPGSIRDVLAGGAPTVDHDPMPMSELDLLGVRVGRLETDDRLSQLAELVARQAKALEALDLRVVDLEAAVAGAAATTPPR